ncbi:MAG: type II secretion system protein [Verrucomicrobiota bacterium]
MTSKSHRADMARVAAFTLIELLVVIVISAILATLLLPALSKAKSATHAAVCKGNLRQWGMALRMYIDDGNGYPYNSTRPPDGDGKNWFQRLQPYTGSKWPRWNGRNFEPNNSIAVCPGYAHLPGQFYSDDGNEASGYGAYQCNQIGSVPAGPPTAVTSKLVFLGLADMRMQENKVANPSDMIAIGDALIAFFTFHPSFKFAPSGQGIIGWGNLNPTDENAMALWPLFGLSPKREEREFSQLRALTKKRHAAQFNMVFCDGHVEGLKPANLFDIRRDDVLRRWNRDNLPHRETVEHLQ